MMKNIFTASALLTLGLLLQPVWSAAEKFRVPAVGKSGSVESGYGKSERQRDEFKLPNVYQTRAHESRERMLALLNAYDFGVSWLRENFTPRPMAGIGVNQGRIAAVLKGGPAVKAGLKLGDRIVEIDGRDVTGLTDGEIVSALRNADRQARIRIEGDAKDRILVKEPYRKVEESVDVNEDVISGLEGRLHAVRAALASSSGEGMLEQAAEIESIREAFSLPYWASLAAKRALWPTLWEFAKG